MTEIFAKQRVCDFTADLNSAKPSPGGGSAAGICGAMAAGLAGMVAHLTSGKKKFAEVEPQMQYIIAKARLLEQEMLGMSQEDADLFGKILSAYRLPQGTEEEKDARQTAIEEAGVTCVEASLRMMSSSIDIIRLALLGAQQGSPTMVTDATASAILARAVLRVASYNVRINLGSVGTESVRNDLSERMQMLLRQAEELESEVLAEADGKIG